MPAELHASGSGGNGSVVVDGEQALASRPTSRAKERAAVRAFIAHQSTETVPVSRLARGVFGDHFPSSDVFSKALRAARPGAVLTFGWGRGSTARGGLGNSVAGQRGSQPVFAMCWVAERSGQPVFARFGAGHRSSRVGLKNFFGIGCAARPLPAIFVRVGCRDPPQRCAGGAGCTSGPHRRKKHFVDRQCFPDVFCEFSIHWSE